MTERSASGAESFGDRWIVVSGASSGIGRAISMELAAQGARVALIGRDAARLDAVAGALGDPARVTTEVVDLAAVNDIAGAVLRIAARTGPIFGLCHAAGVTQTLPLSATRPDRARAVMDINYAAGLELARVITQRAVMTPDEGTVLWISSVYARAGVPGQIAYCASKGAVAAAMRAMAAELAPRKIRVNSLSPGLVRTEMTDPATSRMTAEQWDRIIARHPLGVGRPEDVARAAAFVMNPGNSWITGTDLVVDGGYSLQ